jgi:hypothetical protein
VVSRSKNTIRLAQPSVLAARGIEKAEGRRRRGHKRAHGVTAVPVVRLPHAIDDDAAGVCRDWNAAERACGTLGVERETVRVGHVRQVAQW